MADNDRSGGVVPGSWPETLPSLVAEAGENADAARGLTIAFWSMIICPVAAPLAIVGLFFSLRGLLRSGRLGGRRAALIGIVLNTVGIALLVLALTVLAYR